MEDNLVFDLGTVAWIALECRPTKRNCCCGSKILWPNSFHITSYRAVQTTFPRSLFECSRVEWHLGRPIKSEVEQAGCKSSEFLAPSGWEVLFQGTTEWNGLERWILNWMMNTYISSKYIWSCLKHEQVYYIKMICIWFSPVEVRRLNQSRLTGVLPAEPGGNYKTTTYRTHRNRK